MPGPILWGPNNTANNLQNAALMANGSLISYNGPKNYITYGNFENAATTGWSLGTIGTLTNGLPTGSPTFGSGAAGTLSIATVSSGQIAGNYSLSLVSSAATTQGNMLASQAYTIDAEDQGKVLAYKLAYSIPSGVANANFSGTSSNSFGVAVYDVTNSAWLAVAGAFNLVQNSGVGIATGTFQTAITTASIRLVFYCVNATTGAVTVYLDDISVGPQVTAAGSAMSDLTSYSLTLTGSTANPSQGAVTRNEARWARRGDMMYIRYDYIAGAGSGGSGDLLFSIPAGVTIDSSKITYASGSTVGTSVVGNGGYWASTAGNTAKIPVNVVAYNSTNLALKVVDDSSNNYVTTGNLAGAQILFSFECLVPITGWSSQTVMSNDTDTRVVAASYYCSSSNSVSGNVQINFDTKIYDTHAAVTTGAGSWKYTCPVTGYYRLSFWGFGTATASGRLQLYKNGSIYKDVGYSSNWGTITPNASTTVSLNAGDTIDLRPDAVQTITGGSLGGSSTSYIDIERLCGPATVAASESVNARYFASGTAISGSLATISWTTKDFDSHNAMSAGVYTVPVSGKYPVTAALAVSGTFALNNLSVIEIQKNGTVVSRVKRYAAAAVTQMDLEISDEISCLAGDTLRIQVSSGATSPTIVSSNFENYISLFRSGN